MALPSAEKKGGVFVIASSGSPCIGFEIAIRRGRRATKMTAYTIVSFEINGGCGPFSCHCDSLPLLLPSLLSWSLSSCFLGVFVMVAAVCIIIVASLSLSLSLLQSQET